MDQSDEIRSKFGQIFSAFQKVKNTLMKLEELKTGKPIATPTDAARVWTVKPQTAVYPIIAPLKSRYRARDPQLTTTAWIFKESSAHKLSDSFWLEVDMANMESSPVFIEFDEPVSDAGEMLYGFVAPGDRVVLIDTSVSIVNLVGDTTKVNVKPATSFNKPIEKTVAFKSKRRVDERWSILQAYE